MKKTRLVYDDSNYIEATYLDGTCPRCRIWEAPTTTEELRASKEKYTHVGSGPKIRDKSAAYKRFTWKEYFKCPICQAKISVPFSGF